MKQCIITGGTGLIGSTVTKQLLDKGWKCYTLSRSSFKAGSHPNCHQIKWDFNSSTNINSILPEYTDSIIHLAQSENFRDFPEMAEDVFNVNTLSTLKLLDYARSSGVRNFILASSGGIYGHGDEGFKENETLSTVGDLGFYLGTKLCSEVLAENYVSFMNVIILRFFFVYGPGQRQDMLIPRLINSVKTGTPIILQGQDGIRINPTYVNDAANAVINALELGTSNKINVAGPEILSLREISEAIGTAVGQAPIFKIENNPPKNLVGDISKMSMLLGKPKLSFAEGLHYVLNKQQSIT